MNFPKGPGWPDMRGWAAAGFFALTFYVLYMIEKNPALLSVPSFMQFAGGLIAGGVLAVGAFLFGGTKSGAETSAKIADAYASSTPAPQPTPVAPIVSQPAPDTVTLAPGDHVDVSAEPAP